MCVWMKYEKHEKLLVGIEHGLVTTADSVKLKKSHTYSEFMQLAEENGWKAEPEPELKSQNASVTLYRKA